MARPDPQPSLTPRVVASIAEAMAARCAPREVADGRYESALQLPQGLWVVSIASRREGDPQESAYRLKRRLYVAGMP